jgi:ATP-dependent DNA helicase RecG
MSFTEMQLKEMLERLRQAPSENELFEFKEAKADYSFASIGKYFSALSNEANLKHCNDAWLVFGVMDKGRTIVGSNYRKHRANLDSLKGEIAKQTTNRITFREIYELFLPEGRIVMFQIPPAPRGIPVAFDGHYYGRDGEELSPLNLEEIERIRAQNISADWSAALVPGAVITDLDPMAILKARENYFSKFPDKAEDGKAWNDIMFLNKAKITIKGKITRTAIILLGREESEHFISPAEAKIRWVLKDLANNDKDYEIFSIPLLLAVDKVHAKIRNLKYRYLKDGTLFPDEVLKYEPYVIREALNNCIAHQDYPKSGRINVIEIEDEELIFSNYGSFIPGSVENVVMEDAPEESYRNPFLANAMFNLKMVDTAGGGIKKMFGFQKSRYFPMPEYALDSEKVRVTIIGKVLDMEFARVLAKNPALSLDEIILLDKVQKRKPISEDNAKQLRTLGFIEGRRPNFIISSNIVACTQDGQLKAQYLKQRGFDDDHYREMILEYLRRYGSATRNDINHLLLGKLPEVLSQEQKENKVSNLLGSLRQSGKISNSGTTKKPKYVLQIL